MRILAIGVQTPGGIPFDCRHVPMEEATLNLLAETLLSKHNRPTVVVLGARPWRLRYRIFSMIRELSDVPVWVEIRSGVTLRFPDANLYLLEHEEMVSHLQMLTTTPKAA